ncbi:electron transfer flavoprotein subunit alpha/FixB family protein [soil metagenome]
MSVLVMIEHDRGDVAPVALEAMGFARSLDDLVHALVIGVAGEALAATLGAYGAEVVHLATGDLLGDYGPETWGHTLAHLVGSVAHEVVVAGGTDVGNEVMAHAAALLDVAFAANCVAHSADSAVTGDVAGEAPITLTRVRWGGSLLEVAELTGSPRMLTVSPHSADGSPAEAPREGRVEAFQPDLDSSLARSVVVDRVERAAGVTLATAPVVVGGGRGVGSADGFAPLEELAAELGGVVGCSRAVTNNGWRNHTDQVGQTGTRIAPDLYMACGISGAIQHWVGAMASKRILAVNTDRDANMVTKADYAVIGDLHEVIPAITAEVRRRRG